MIAKSSDRDDYWKDPDSDDVTDEEVSKMIPQMSREMWEMTGRTY
jgi:hypothetical protein